MTSHDRATIELDSRESCIVAISFLQGVRIPFQFFPEEFFERAVRAQLTLRNLPVNWARDICLDILSTMQDVSGGL